MLKKKKPDRRNQAFSVQKTNRGNLVNKTNLTQHPCANKCSNFKEDQCNSDFLAGDTVVIIDHNATVRQTAKRFGISKSTVHKDCTERLISINPALAAQTRVVLDLNKSERHIRGGMATREKYLHLGE